MTAHTVLSLSSFNSFTKVILKKNMLMKYESGFSISLKTFLQKRFLYILQHYVISNKGYVILALTYGTGQKY